MSIDWAHHRDGPVTYGDDTTYELGAAWLRGLHVADWGAGWGRFAELFDGPVTSIDGTESPKIAYVADLQTYVKGSHGIFLRHVLEHNEGWEQILTNALVSCKMRLFLAVYTPDSDTDELIREYADGIHIRRLPTHRITQIMAEYGYVTTYTVESGTEYGQERVWQWTASP